MGIDFSDENLWELRQLNNELLIEMREMQEVDNTPEVMNNLEQIVSKVHITRTYNKLQNYPGGWYSRNPPNIIVENDAPKLNWEVKNPKLPTEFPEPKNVNIIEEKDGDTYLFCGGTVELPPEKDNGLNIILFIGALVMTAEMRDVAIGDMEERFHKYACQFGKSKAKSILVWDLARSVIPVIYAFVSGLVVKSIKFAGLYKFLKFLFEKYTGS